MDISTPHPALPSVATPSVLPSDAPTDGLSAWADIDLDAIRDNVARLGELAGDADVMAVIKGDAYGHGLSDKPEIVALSQIDLADEEMRAEKMAALEHASGTAVLGVSSATRDGVEPLLRALMAVIEAARAEHARDADDQREPWQPLAGDG